MEGSKFWEMYALLRGNERAKWLRFVRSPYHNVNPQLAAMAGLLARYYEPPSKEEVWTGIYPGRTYDDLVMRRHMSELLALTGQFLVAEEHAEQSRWEHVTLLQALRKRDATGLYEFYFRKGTGQTASNSEGKDGKGLRFKAHSQGYLLDYLLESERNAWLERSANRSGVTNLEASVASLDRFYLFNKLKYACTRLNNRNVVGGEFQDPLIEGLLSQLDDSPYAQDLGVLIYFRIYQMLSRPEDASHYHGLRAVLKEHVLAFTQDEARHLYAFAMNFCIGRINAGEGNYLREIFGLYQESLAARVLFEGDSLSPWDFKNIVVVGLRLSEFDWVERFIHQYRENIPTEYRDNAFTYNLAKLHFYKRDYSAVLRLLQRLEYEDVFYNLDAKTMLLKIYYEQREYDALDSLIESFRIFLRRNKLISEHHRTNYLNLVRFVKKLSRVRYGDRKRLVQIAEDIDGTRQIADKDWLRERIKVALGSGKG